MPGLQSHPISSAYHRFFLHHVSNFSRVALFQQGPQSPQRNRNNNNNNNNNNGPNSNLNNSIPIFSSQLSLSQSLSQHNIQPIIHSQRFSKEQSRRGVERTIGKYDRAKQLKIVVNKFYQQIPSPATKQIEPLKFDTM